MTDRIVLTIPTDPRFRGVGTLVVGGVGARLELSYERMEDLQLALLSALDAAFDGEVTLEIDAAPDGLTLTVGPLRDGSASDGGLGLVLSRLVDEVEHEHRDGKAWVALRVAPRAPG
ncbi:MAG TPA: hypothetical protein VMK83_07610 [Gaiellaceae bacterium]|nr:hypothetical protein [Gaiellaceae bacterium]